MLTGCVQKGRFGHDGVIAACASLGLLTGEHGGITFVEVPPGRLEGLADELRRLHLPLDILYFNDCPTREMKDWVLSFGFKAVLGGRGKIIRVARGYYGLGKWVPIWDRSSTVAVNYNGGINVPNDLLRTIDVRPNRTVVVTEHRHDGVTMLGLRSDTIRFPESTEEVVGTRPVDRRGRVRIGPMALRLLGPPADSYVVKDEWAWLSISKRE